MLLIDSHIHVGQYFDRYFSPQDISSLMKAVGVDYYAVSSTTMCEENYPKVLDELHELIRLDGDKMIPIMWITPEGLKGNIAWFLESDIQWKCLKIHPSLHPDKWSIKEGMIDEVVDIARELQVPLLIHTGNEECCHAQIFEPLLMRNPDVMFILAHGRTINEAISLAEIYSNAYLDSAFMPIPDMQQIISHGLSHKLLWGTDMCIPAHFYPNADMRVYYTWHLNELSKICSAAEYERITYHNACKIFNINTNLKHMAYYFSASRVTGGNAVFPDQIIIDVDNETLTYRKKKLIGYDDVKLRFGAIGCVSRSAGLVFCDVIIETNGGRTIRAKGFSRSDAEEIIDLLS